MRNPGASTYRSSTGGTRPQSTYTPRSGAAPGRASRIADSGATRAATSSERVAQQMLKVMLTPPRDSRLPGEPMRLATVLRNTPDRTRQAELVESYWALTASVADYYLGLHEANELDRLRRRLPTYSEALGEAQSVQRARVDTSLRAARAGQLRLGRLMGGGAQPLPADTPFSGPYATRFQAIFPGGAPEEARVLNELIPLRYGELQDAVAGVKRSEQWLDKVAADQGPGSTGLGMIRGLELLALNRRAFVQIVRDYNLQIHRYSQLVSPDDIDTDRLVAMLIRTDSVIASRGTDATADGRRSAGLEFRPGASSRR